ncbi:hypothetical protein AB0F73_02070 [Micromonospora purpureochromogenes]|uniref:hypothetical protein n=1 Tax=Micromonospora purpureochromogenes TaxID=47872 RepID=UPI0033FF292F
MSTVTYLGAPGIDALRQVRELVTSAGGRLTLREAPPFVLRILGVTGVPAQLDLDIASARSTATVPPVVTRFPLARGHGGSTRRAHPDANGETCSTRWTTRESPWRARSATGVN